MLAVTILGNNSAVPAFNRHPTSQVITIDGTNLLMDCGEGTQIQMINYKIRRSKISHIFISHLHGDHYFGLIGLINSFGLLSHQQELHVFGPSPLQEIIELQLKVADTKLSYPLYFHTISDEVMHKRQAETHEDSLAAGAAFFRRFKHFGTCRAFGIF